MELKDILVNIGRYDDTINKIFPNKDYITMDELFIKIQDLYCEVDSLKEEIENLKKPKEPDYYDTWHDQQLEEGEI